MALREIKVEWDTFNFKIYCVIGPHHLLPAYVRKRHRRVYRYRPEADLRGLYFPHLPLKGGILWLPKKPRTPKELGALAHEVSHAVVDMHSKRGINLDRINDEPFCYSIQHGITTILEACK